MRNLLVSLLSLATVAWAVPNQYDYRQYNDYFNNRLYANPYYLPYGAGQYYGYLPYDNNYIPGAYHGHQAYQVPQAHGAQQAYQAPQAYQPPQVPQASQAYQAPQAYQPPQVHAAPPAYNAPQQPKVQPANYAKLGFIGRFEGSCKGKKDGLYYIDYRSFAFCSNEIKTIQNCPDASENPPEKAFSTEPDSRFCSINRLKHESR